MDAWNVVDSSICPYPTGLNTMKLPIQSLRAIPQIHFIQEQSPH